MATALFQGGRTDFQSLLLWHALVQDTAYSTLMRGRRHELHARVVASLEQHFDDLVERHPELLAHHLTSCGATEPLNSISRGTGASARLNYLEAIRYYDRGLALLES